MQDIIVYLIFVILGGITGVVLRKTRGSRGPIPVISLIKSIAICTLLFVMSTRIGSNEEVAKNLGTIGIYGLIFTIIVMAVTLVTAFVFRKALGFNAYGAVDKSSELAVDEESAKGNAKEIAKETGATEKTPIDKTTIFIIVFVILGILCGRLFVNKLFDDYDRFVELASMTIKIGLSTLLYFVGFDLGYEESGMTDFKNAGIKIIFFPVATTVGTLLGGVVAYFLIPVSLRESLAIASGFGWYSLAPVLIMDAGHVTASAISFLHNVLRELFSIVLIPFIAKYVGYIEASCVPGAPAMDICLPVVERSTNGTVAIYSFINGSVTSLLVPVLISIFLR